MPEESIAEIDGLLGSAGAAVLSLAPGVELQSD